MGPPKEFTITVTDRVFVLTEDQIRRDAPNYFTMLFEGSFKEAREGIRELKINRDPYLFTFIHMHLCGYKVLPLPKDTIPSHLSEGSRLKNLLVDAQFYGLDSLAEELEAEIIPETKSDLDNPRCAEGKAWRVYKRENLESPWSCLVTFQDTETYHWYSKSRSVGYIALMDTSELPDKAEKVKIWWGYGVGGQQKEIYAIGTVTIGHDLE